MQRKPDLNDADRTTDSTWTWSQRHDQANTPFDVKITNQYPDSVLASSGVKNVRPDVSSNLFWRVEAVRRKSVDYSLITEHTGSWKWPARIDPRRCNRDGSDDPAVCPRELGQPRDGGDEDVRTNSQRYVGLLGDQTYSTDFDGGVAPPTKTTSTPRRSRSPKAIQTSSPRADLFSFAKARFVVKSLRRTPIMAVWAFSDG